MTTAASALSLLLAFITMPLLVGCANGGPNRADLLLEASPVEAEAAAEQFNNIFVLDQIWFAGQPTEDGLRWAKEQGVATVINIRSLAEMPARVPFDEPALVDELGMEYVAIPLTPATFSAAHVDLFSAAMEKAYREGGVLFHCGSSNRVGGLWAAYLHAEHGVEQELAIELGKKAGLKAESMIAAANRVMEEMGEED